VKDHGNLLLCKEVPCLKNLQSLFCNLSQCTWLLLLTKCIFVTNALKWSKFFLRNNGKALCERPFALHRQQTEKYKQNVDVSPWKNFCGRPWKICRSLLYVIRPVTSLGHQEGWRVFWEGPKFFELCPIVLNHVQHIFPVRAKIFFGGLSPPWLRPCT